MSFVYPEIPQGVDQPELISQFNLFLNELIEYLNSRELSFPTEQIRAPYDGQLAWSTLFGWLFPGGPGLYVYNRGLWYRFGRVLRGFPVDTQLGSGFSTANPYTTVNADFTDPVTCWPLTGAVDRVINLHSVADGSKIAFWNQTNGVVRINYTSGGYMLLDPGESVCLQYTTLFYWSAL